ncbi:restriction endonuclease subunit S [Brachyspira hyodysenteriae]|uniref:restriction endonuclease subunit S n=1 Tax=Brachyspira hyodysenteriae TaxID=159 RepID=UPI0022CD5DF7|nr:restriction endonuclease subunit S [Brachyspira hyodysenteriae]MCZ9838972.1 restriction endonuclease subunit S [Brachyspira hyodysenteriae]MCZ9847591.1 restriction endonuclease subunit S [Brachyspira hyodysenteriae]MCZ9929293.1 restriction endonuclease subunit S [Brachyspira hyodysenteriae]
MLFKKIESLENNTKENIKNIEDLYNSYLNKIFTENTDDWEEKTLDELCYILDSKRVPITKKYRNTGIYPYYGATGIQDYIDSYIFDETLLLVGEDGAKWGRCENTAFIVTGKFWVNNHAHVLKIKKDTIYEWLKYCLNYTDLSEYITGTTVPKLNQEKLKQIKVPIPKIEEQKKIVDKLDIFNNKIESIKQNYQNKLTLLEKLKKSILKKAFNGEL